VDILDQAGRGGVERSWSALLQAAGPELLFMGFTVLAVRLVVTAANTLLEEQVMGPSFYNLIRWQANSYVLQQSYGFFQNDFAGRIATKVWQAGQAAGDFIQSLSQVVWFMLIYSISTLFLIGRLDWTLAAVVLAWTAVFVLLPRHYLPQIPRQGG